MSRRLLIFLKYPTSGQVKTRLASVLGDAAATAVYRACVEMTLQRMRPFRKEAVLHLSPGRAIPRTRQWLGPDWRLKPQQGDSLGERLIRATAEAFAHAVKRVIVIGTDSPWLGAERVEAAFEALKKKDLVIGPTDDGGYYLIGLSKRAPGLFQNVAWSTARVHEQTLANAKQLGLSVRKLARGYDVDTLSDLKRFLNEGRAG